MATATKPPTSPVWLEILAIDGSTRPTSIYAYAPTESPHTLPIHADLLPGLGYIDASKVDALTGAIDREVTRGTMRLLDIAKMTDANLIALVARSIDGRALGKLAEATTSAAVREVARARQEYVATKPIGWLLHDPTGRAA